MKWIKHKNLKDTDADRKIDENQGKDISTLNRIMILKWEKL